METPAYCGFLCSQCAVYRATKSGDRAEKVRLAAQYSTKTNLLLPEDICCEGCQSASADHVKMCKDCEIRLCSRGQNHQSCADCEQYPCAYFLAHIPPDSPSRMLLDKIKKEKAEQN